MSMLLNHGKLLNKLRKDAELNRLAAVSRRLEIPYMTLSDIIRDGEDNKGTLRTWLRIEAYYTGRNINP